jgi:hypothetical protein
MADSNLPTEPRSADGAGRSALLPADRPALLPEGVLAAMRADPTHAPEHLALAAVERLGPEAHTSVIKLRAQFPTATDANLAKLVRDRFVRQARLSGAAAGVAGAPGAVIDFGVLAWTQARMVLHLAAVHRHDPRERERAAELLVLTGVHKYQSAAEKALDVAARKAPVTSLIQTRGGSWLQLAGALAQMVGLRAIKRAVAKVVPFASVPLGAIANSSATGKLARETIALYGSGPKDPKALDIYRST